MIFRKKIMSRIGKLPINIKDGVEVVINGRNVHVKGQKGELSYDLKDDISIAKEDSVLKVGLTKETKESRELWGLTRTLIDNMVQGVSEGFEKQLSIHGVGYRAVLEGNTLVLSVGFSHQVKILIPEGIAARIEKNVITISGFDKVKVGQFAADIRAVKKPEPYKGKGIRYVGEYVRRKAGKTAKA